MMLNIPPSKRANSVSRGRSQKEHELMTPVPAGDFVQGTDTATEIFACH